MYIYPEKAGTSGERRHGEKHFKQQQAKAKSGKSSRVGLGGRKEEEGKEGEDPTPCPPTQKERRGRKEGRRRKETSRVYLTNIPMMCMYACKHLLSLIIYIYD